MLSGPFCVSGVGWFVSGGLSGGIIVAAKEFPQPQKTDKGGEFRLSPLSPGLFAEGKIIPMAYCVMPQGFCSLYGRRTVFRPRPGRQI